MPSKSPASSVKRLALHNVITICALFRADACKEPAEVRVVKDTLPYMESIFMSFASLRDRQVPHMLQLMMHTASRVCRIKKDLLVRVLTAE